MEQLAIAPAITVLINVIKPFIPNKNILPVIAIILWWCAWLLMDWDMLTNVLQGIITWAWAVWLHQLTKLWDTKKVEVWETGETPQDLSLIREDV